MGFFSNIVTRIKNSEDLAELRSSTLRDILNGNVLTRRFIRRQYLLLGLLVVIAIFYNDNRYSSEKQISRISELKKQIQDAKYESLTISAELVETTRRSSIERLLKEKGVPLTTGTNPPIVIEKVTTVELKK
jgi:hypothetical protein